MEDEEEAADEENDDEEEYTDSTEKMTALYGDEWKVKSPENLMEVKYFKEIPEFLQSGTKIVKAETVSNYIESKFQ